MHTTAFLLVPTRSGQRYTQVFMYLIYKDFNKSAHLRSFVINQSVIEAPQDLCITLTAERGNEQNVGVEALAGRGRHPIKGRRGRPTG